MQAKKYGFALGGTSNTPRVARLGCSLPYKTKKIKNNFLFHSSSRVKRDVWAISYADVIEL